MASPKAFNLARFLPGFWVPLSRPSNPAILLSQVDLYSNIRKCMRATRHPYLSYPLQIIRQTVNGGCGHGKLSAQRFRLRNLKISSTRTY